MGEPSLSTDNIQPLIHTIRGVRVILAADLAGLSAVPPFRLNEAVKRNKVRFPTDFIFQLTVSEWDNFKDKALRDIYQKLLPLLQPPPKPKMGFREKSPRYGPRK
jgi:hypothetical protein